MIEAMLLSQLSGNERRPDKKEKKEPLVCKGIHAKFLYKKLKKRFPDLVSSKGKLSDDFLEARKKSLINPERTDDDKDIIKFYTLQTDYIENL